MLNEAKNKVKIPDPVYFKLDGKKISDKQAKLAFDMMVYLLWYLDQLKILLQSH